MSKAMEHIRYLVDIAGYRSSSSEGERRASEYIKEVLEGLGVESNVENFLSYRTSSYGYIIIYFICIIGALFSLSHEILGFLMAVFGAIAFYRENSCQGVVSRLLTHAPSQNVVGRIPAKDKVCRRVVLCANYDTARSGLMFHPCLAGFFRTFSVFTIISVLGLPVIILFGSLFWPDFFGLFRSFAVLWLCLNIIFLVHKELYGRDIYGANDNASGTGVILALAEKLAKDPMPNTEIWIAATGSEGAGNGGTLALLTRHAQELQEALFLNLNNLGAGYLKYITGEGMIKAYSADPELLLFSAELVRENMDVSLVPHEFRTFTTSAYAALARGYRAMSIMALDEDGLIPNWRWETDLIENLEENNLIEAENFITLLLKKLDRER